MTTVARRASRGGVGVAVSVAVGVAVGVGVGKEDVAGVLPVGAAGRTVPELAVLTEAGAQATKTSTDNNAAAATLPLITDTPPSNPTRVQWGRATR